MELVELTVRKYANEGEAFDPEAWENTVGDTYDFRCGLGILPDGIRLTGAQVAKDGSYADLVLEMPMMVAALIPTGLLS